MVKIVVDDGAAVHRGMRGAAAAGHPAMVDWSPGTDDHARSEGTRGVECAVHHEVPVHVRSGAECRRARALRGVSCADIGDEREPVVEGAAVARAPWLRIAPRMPSGSWGVVEAAIPRVSACA